MDLIELTARGFLSKITNEGVMLMKNLQKLNVEYNQNITSNGIIQLKLTELNIGGGLCLIGNTGIMGMTTLKVLKCSDNFRVTSEGLRALNLDELYIDCCSFFDDEDLKDLKHLQLKVLSIIDCENITRDGISHMNLKRLEHSNQEMFGELPGAKYHHKYYGHQYIYI
jgi:hypothetical protein